MKKQTKIPMHYVKLYVKRAIAVSLLVGFFLGQGLIFFLISNVDPFEGFVIVVNVVFAGLIGYYFYYEGSII